MADGEGRGEPLAPQPWSHPLTAPSCPPGWQTGPPDFVGIGAQRCGTSWWYRGAIRPHPRVAEARERRKELHFFDRYWAADPEPDYAERYASFFPRPEGSIAGEWTPRYMHDPWTLPLLAAAAPAARFLILLRDPIERYRSGLRHELERSRRRGQDPPNIAIMGDAVFRGFYRRQVERALELFGRDRVLVLQYERCVDAPLEQMRHTQQFLGLEPLSELTEPIQRDRRDSPAKPPLPDHLRGHLKEAYAGDVTALAELCPEIDPGLWPNFADG